MFWFKGMPKSSEVAVEKEERVKTELSERKKKIRKHQMIYLWKMVGRMM